VKKVRGRRGEGKIEGFVKVGNRDQMKFRKKVKKPEWPQGWGRYTKQKRNSKDLARQEALDETQTI